MQDFPANSRRAQERSAGPPEDKADRRVEQITSVDASVRKRGLGRKFRETFIGGTARGAAEYAFTDIVIPEVRDLIFNTLQTGLERYFFGESRGGRRSSSGPPSGYSDVGRVNYAGYSKPQGTRVLSQRSRARHDFGEIVIPDQAEANDVLDRLYEELSRFGEVKVAVLYELTGIQTTHADHNWGWTSLRGARARRLRSGDYLLDLPDPEPLGR